MSTNLFDDFDAQSQEILDGLKFLNLEEVKHGIVGQDPLAAIRTSKTFDEISNEYAMKTPFDKDSIFYKAKKGTVRAYLENKNSYEKAKSKPLVLI